MNTVFEILSSIIVQKLRHTHVCNSAKITAILPLLDFCNSAVDIRDAINTNISTFVYYFLDKFLTCEIMKDACFALNKDR